MSEHNESYAYFTITGDFDPAEITAKVGIQPTDSWKKGDRHGKKQIEYKFSRWSLRSSLPDIESLENHIADVLKQLSKNKEGFRDISMKNDGCMQLVGIFNVDYPGLHFDSDLVSGLADYSLSVDFDFYHYWDTEEEMITETGLNLEQDTPLNSDLRPS